MTRPPTRPQPRYEDLELNVELEPDPRVPHHPKPYRLVHGSRRRSGCNWGCITALAVAAAFWAVVLLVAAGVGL